MGKFVTDEEIRNLTAYHPPKDEQTKEAHEEVRRAVCNFSLFLNDMLAESPQKTHLLRQVIPEVMMRANQVIAVHGLDPDYRAQKPEEDINEPDSQRVEHWEQGGEAPTK